MFLCGILGEKEGDLEETKRNWQYRLATVTYVGYFMPEDSYWRSANLPVHVPGTGRRYTVLVGLRVAPVLAMLEFHVLL